MSKMMVLDCTLRDGGYCNQWKFGLGNIKKIVTGLSDANVDIIECGFLTSKVVYDKDVTKYTSILEANQFLPNSRRGQIYVLMMNYGEYNIDKLPERKPGGIDGIRIAFHKKDLEDAIRHARKIKEKGYLLFLQPMVTLSYSDSDFLMLISMTNELAPYAFYIVDSFGTMKRKELVRLYYLTDHNLDGDIVIGFHSHNNMQLAYANAQTLCDIHSKHDLIIDSSIYGMGRGAGNLNTELFLDYLNDNFGRQYQIRPIIKLIDDILDNFYKQNYWGYSLPNYLSATYDTHPNYAGYLSDKNTLNVEDMDAILGMMDDRKRVYFDREYAEKLYIRYLSSGEAYEKHKGELYKELKENTVLLIAPGRSSHDEREIIKEYVDKHKVKVISVNHEYQYIRTNYIFLSNLRRFRELDGRYYEKCIVTSNIPSSDIYLQCDYVDLLNDNEAVRDNAGLMAIKFLIGQGVKEIVLAGFDGYSYDSAENYASNHLLFVTKKALVDAMNDGMNNVLLTYMKKVNLKMLTIPKNLDVGQYEGKR